ncbi:S8 family serine peptidase [Actinoplanes sp. NEAU-A12]|uniref:S8 family serine peptidase n=1 Tax=Actinoplanes sandaracinus TaxID=3045177 RepID=A0ABT6WGR9_9ACTN|nr:S8 family serine peptidase [Actinoplanes sandaracinus]MDI6098920.1 S8 family serine peptidase [Actinoplanes sandaracinus]
MPPSARRRQPSPPDPDSSSFNPRERHYLVARRDPVLLPAGETPLSGDALEEMLRSEDGVVVERTMGPQSLAVLLDTPASLQQVILARMSDEKAAELAANRQILVEEDAPLQLSPVAPPVEDINPAALNPFGAGTTWRIRVTGPDDAPVANAAVFLYGSGVPAQGRTDDDGNTEVTLFNDSPDTLRALYVNPQSRFWSLWLDRPRLISGDVNQVKLVPLASMIPNLSDNQIFGWGQRIMRLDRLDPSTTAANIKVAVIDSGAATSHRDLGHIRRGQDLTVLPPDDATWANDTLGHGSHCSGIIAARDAKSGIRGFAPQAQIHELRIFPGGRFSSLLDALDYCIEQQIDVVNMSLGTQTASELVAQKIRQAKQFGVACIAAAGNSAGPVQFPGSIRDDVLTVSAVGRVGEFPPNSFHAQQNAGPVDNGYFFAKFSCFGPEVDVCAPGVAVLSSVPADGYAAWDGTSMAAPHVAGLAALTLANHPDFTDGFKGHDAARVDRLFQIIKQSATQLNLGGPERTGAGVPDVLRALGTAAAAPATGGAGADIITAQLEELRRAYADAGLL